MSDGAVEGLPETPGEPTGLPAEGAEPETTQEVDAGDFEARLRGDPEFALSEFKKQQARADRAVNEMKQKAERYRDLDPWIDNLGGSAAVLHHLGRLGAVMGNPQLRMVVEEFERTGRLPGVGATDSRTEPEPEYLDPVEKEVRDLRKKIAELEGGFAGEQASRAKDRLRNDISQVLSEHDYLSDEDRGLVLQKLEENIRKWDQNPEGRALLGQISKEHLETIVVDTIFRDKERRRSVAERIARQRQANKEAASTVVASPVQTNGREMSRAAKSALEIVREQMRKEGLALR